MMPNSFLGSCITSVLPGDVCGLAAVATECPEGSMMASTCECDPGFLYNTTSTECVGQ